MMLSGHFQLYLYRMKSKFILIGMVVCMGVLFLSAGTLLTSKDADGLLETRTNLALRSIGHQLMLEAGDSSSQLLPVTQIDPLTFQLEFRGSFTFIPDTLVKVVQRKLEEKNLSSHYVVKVLNCNDRHQIVYGYEFAEKQDVTIPCQGRKQPVGCYVIQIVFPENKVGSYATYVWMFTISMMGLVGFVGMKYLGKEKDRDISIGGEFILLGKYAFYIERRILLYQQKSIELSDKETKLLKIFATNQNQTIDRDRLLKEVWEDDGVFVGRSLDVFVSKLRKKLQGDPSLRIINIHGKGYKLETGVIQ